MGIVPRDVKRSKTRPRARLTRPSGCLSTRPSARRTRPGREYLTVGSFLDLAHLSGVHAQPEQVQLRLAHHAPESEQEAVVVVRGVVDAIRVGDERSPERAQVQKGVPVGVVSGEAARLVAEYYADVPERHLADQLSETLPAVGALAREAQVGVDHAHPVRAPPQIGGPLGECLLVLAASRIPQNLFGGGLPDVDVGAPLEMGGGDLLGLP